MALTTKGGITYVIVSQLSDLSDIVITNPTNGQAIIYQNGVWVNGSATAAASGADGSIQFATSSVLNSDTGLVWDNTNKWQVISSNALGASTKDGIILQNTTAATAGAQQVSPSIHWSGKGWATTPVNSQSVDFISWVSPTQGAANPTGTWALQASINAGAYANALTVTNAGTVTATAGMIGTSFLGSGSSGVTTVASNTTPLNANFNAISTNFSGSTNTARYLFGGAASVNYRVAIGGVNATTAITAGNNVANLLVAASPILAAISGTNAWACNAVITAIGTYTAGVGTVTNSASLYIAGAASFAGSNYCFYVNSTIPFSIDGGGAISGQQSLITSSAGINAKTVANTTIFTPVPAGKQFIITGIIIRCTAASAITIGPTLGIGTASGTNDIFASTVLTALTTTNDVFGFALVGMSKAVAAAGSVFLNLGTAATGTSQTIVADIKGYFI